MNEDYFKKVYEFFKEFAEKIDGYLIASLDYLIVRVIKDDIIIEYQFGNRDTTPSFVLSTPLELNNVFFEIYKKKILNLEVDLIKYRDIKDYSVFIPSYKNEKTMLLMDRIFNDFEYKAILEKYLKKWAIQYKYNTLCIGLDRSIDPIIQKKISIEELYDVYHLIKETKEVLLYYNKKI